MMQIVKQIIENKVRFNNIKKYWWIISILSLTACGFNVDTAEPPSPLPEFTEQAAFKVLWRAKLTKKLDEYDQPLQPYISSGRIFIADSKGTISALNKENGDLIWKEKTADRISGGIGGAAGLLFVGTRNGELVAYWQKNGEEAWRTQTSSEILSVPASDLGVVVVRTLDGNVQAFASTTGQKLWSYKYSVPSLSLRGTSSPIIFAGGVLCGTDNGRLTALSLDDGRLLWETPVTVPSGGSELARLVDIDIPVIIDKGIIYSASYQGRTVAVNMQGGQVQWARDNSVYKPMSLDTNNLYVVDQKSHIWSLDRIAGSTVWKQDKLHARPVSGVANVGDALLVGDFEGYLHAVSNADGRLIGRIRLGKLGIDAAPQIENDIIYVYTRDGILAALTLDTKTS